MMKHWDILGIPKDDFQIMDSTGKNRIIKKICMVESHNMKLLQTYCKYFGILQKASALESKQFHQNLLCAVCFSSK